MKGKIKFKATIEKFGQKGEKSGWTYVPVSAELGKVLKPQCRKSFRVSGFIDQIPVHAVALIPMGEGNFILPLNAAMRKSLRKMKGDSVQLKLHADESAPALSTDLLICLSEEPKANDYFSTLPMSHQRYFSNWVESAKTDTTKAKRIAAVISATIEHLSFSEMMHKYKEERSGFK